MPRHYTKDDLGVVSVKEFGAIGDGVTDDTSFIRNAINSLPAGGKVILPKRSYKVTSSIVVPVGVNIEGLDSTIVVPKDNAFDVFVITNGNNQRISNLKIIETGRSFTQRATGKGLLINGNSNQILLENIYVEGCQSGIAIAPSTETSTQITLRNCNSVYSSQYGYVLDNVDGVTFDNCYASHNWLDGFKFRKKTKNVRIIGGESRQNGESWYVDPLNNGNGLDTYAGGDNFTIIDLICIDNKGDGIYIKSGDLNYQTSANTYGYVKNVQLTNVKCKSNLKSGLDFNRVSADTAGTGATYPLVTNVVVVGGIFEENGEKGIYVRGRNVTIVSPIVKGNQEEGINVANGYNVEIVSPQVIANSKKTAGTYYGISLFGKRIKVLGGIIDGADADSLANDDYTGLTVYHARPINAVSGSDDITIKDVTYLNWVSTSIPVRAVWTTGNIFIDYGKISSSSAYGSAGSTMVYNGVKYIKTTDVTDISSWEPINKKAITQADSTATDVTTLTADFNALLAKLKTAKLMA